MDVPTLDGPAASLVGRSSTSYYDAVRGSQSPFFRGGVPGHGACPVAGVLAVGHFLSTRGISEMGVPIVLASWEPGTVDLYEPPLTQSTRFCFRWDVNSLAPSVSDVIIFCLTLSTETWEMRRSTRGVLSLHWVLC